MRFVELQRLAALNSNIVSTVGVDPTHDGLRDSAVTGIGPTEQRAQPDKVNPQGFSLALNNLDPRAFPHDSSSILLENVELSAAQATAGIPWDGSQAPASAVVQTVPGYFEGSDSFSASVTSVNATEPYISNEITPSNSSETLNLGQPMQPSQPLVQTTPQFRRSLSSNLLAWEAFRHILQLGINESPEKLLKVALEYELDMCKVWVSGLQTIGNRSNFTLGELFVSGLRNISNGHKIRARSPSPFYVSGTTDPYSNTLQLFKLPVVDAYIYNAHAIGLLEENFYMPEFPSPFYRSVADASNISTIQTALSEGIPPHLQPTPEQIMYPHLPFFDILPFPSLRSRAIMLWSFDPPLLDYLDLKKDIAREGLVCWHADRTGNGNPRDMRSWEAEPWFLKKWWTLLGGRNGEAWEQTKWWREFRGDSMNGIIPDRLG
jgi:hypothetical protein